MNDFDGEHQRGVAELEAQLADKTGAIQGICEWGGESFLELARRQARELTAHDRPPEFRLEGFLRRGIIDAFDGRTGNALRYFEEARRLAIDLEDYDRAAQAVKLVAIVTEDPDEAEAARALQLEYEAEAEKWGAPERFQRFEIDHD
jgi:hypothetical protein